MTWLSLVVCLSVSAAAPTRTLTLNEALQTATGKQPQLRASQANLRVQTAKVGEALSGFLPRLDAQGQYQRSTGNFTLSPAFASPALLGVFVSNPALGGASALKNTWDTVNYFTYGITAQITIWDFGKTTGNYDAAVASESASRAELSNTDADVALNVRVDYFQTLTQKELVSVGLETVSNQQKHVDEIKQMVGAGTRPKIDLSTAEVNLDNAELTLVGYKNQYEVAKVKLNKSMGVVTDTNFELVVPEEVVIPEETQPEEDVVTRALDARAELVKIKAQLDQVEAVRRAATAAFFPAFNAVANFAGAQVNKLPHGWNFYVGAGLTWNLFGGLNTYHQRQEDSANYEAISAQYDIQAQQIRADLLQDLLAVSEAKQRVKVTTHAAATADEQLSLAEGRYKAGVGTILELDDAQFSRANSQASRVRAQYDLSTARARLVRAMGRAE